MVLLLGEINPDNVCLIGGWRSGEDFIYLHVTVQKLMQVHVTMMFDVGDCATIFSDRPVMSGMYLSSCSCMPPLTVSRLRRRGKK